MRINENLSSKFNSGGGVDSDEAKLSQAAKSLLEEYVVQTPEHLKGDNSYAKDPILKYGNISLKDRPFLKSSSLYQTLSTNLTYILNDMRKRDR